jgi:hypothetical protein
LVPHCLQHHYPFDGTGTTVADVVGGADATSENAALSNGGSLALEGAFSDQYAALPPGLVSSALDVTIEVWTTWNDTPGDWQRILDFGNNDLGAGAQGRGLTYLFITPRDGNEQLLKASFTLSGQLGETVVKASGPLASGTLEHLALVIDGTASELLFYSNGSLVGSNGPLEGSLLDLNDENVWLGRSQFAGDPAYGGTLHDVRIYSTARTPAQIAASFAAGPDALPAE